MDVVLIAAEKLREHLSNTRLHVNGEVGYDGVACSREHEQGDLQWKQLLVDLEDTFPPRGSILASVLLLIHVYCRVDILLQQLHLESQWWCFDFFWLYLVWCYHQDRDLFRVSNMVLQIYQQCRYQPKVQLWGDCGNYPEYEKCIVASLEEGVETRRTQPPWWHDVT